MKKIILPLLAVAVLASCDNKKDQEINALKEQVAYLKDSVAATDAPKPSLVTFQMADVNTPGFNMFVTGSIATYRDAQITVSAGEGSAMFAAQERGIRFKSYDSSNSQLVLEAFYLGEYIGDYVGTYAGGRYTGIFTNVKNGGQINFDLYDINE